MSNLTEREHVAGIRPTAQFLTPTQAGIVIGFSYKWLECRRLDGKGPPWIKVAGRIRYPRQGLLDWMAAHPVHEEGRP